MISIIIPTRNRSKLLSECLESLYRNSCMIEFEVIVVDNGSTDDTKTVTESYKSKFKQFRSIVAPKLGLHVGRHEGMNAAQGDILVYLDDDVEIIPNYLESIKSAFKNPEVVLVGGNNIPMFQSKPPSWLIELWDRGASRGYKSIPALSIIEFMKPPMQISPFQIWGCNFSIRKKVLLDAGGFHPDGMPKELIHFRGDGESHVSRYIKSNKLLCEFHPGASVYHKVTNERMGADYFRLRGYNEGISVSFAQLRQPNKNILNLFKISLSNFLHSYFTLGIYSFFASVELKHVQKEYQKGFREGYEFHQRIYDVDQDVQYWVHKDIYY